MNRGILAATLRLQPVVVLYAAVSVCSKWAAHCLETPREGLPKIVFGDTLVDIRVPGLVVLMFFLLAVYAWLWQKIIARVPITIAYANKASYLLWTQLAAVALFGETVSLGNWGGLALVLAGVLLVNRGCHD